MEVSECQSVSVDHETLASYSLHCDGTDTPLPEQPVWRVHNVVSTSQIMSGRMPIDLQSLSYLLPHSSYDRKTFAAITIRTEAPFCTALLFSSGKLVVTGVKSWNECLYAAKCIVEMLNNACPQLSFTMRSCRIQNMVAHGAIPMPENCMLDIQSMYENNSVESTYQRKMFPGLIFRSMRIPVVILCFFSGKVVLTGAKAEADIHAGWQYLLQVVQPYIRQQ